MSDVVAKKSKDPWDHLGGCNRKGVCRLDVRWTFIVMYPVRYSGLKSFVQDQVCVLCIASLLQICRLIRSQNLLRVNKPTLGMSSHPQQMEHAACVRADASVSICTSQRASTIAVIIITLENA